LNLINSKWAIILPGVSGAFNIFLIRQFMMGIPKELDEAAKIDGANSFQIYYKIIMPLSAPVLTVVAMFAFTGSWNDFLWPSLVINNIEKLTITPGMQLLKGTYNTFPAHALAGGVLAILPTFIFFLFAQKYFLKGMQLQSGVKG
jgi:multiple sugar transport system permease protein